MKRIIVCKLEGLKSKELTINGKCSAVAVCEQKENELTENFQGFILSFIAVAFIASCLFASAYRLGFVNQDIAKIVQTQK